MTLTAKKAYAHPWTTGMSRYALRPASAILVAAFTAGFAQNAIAAALSQTTSNSRVEAVLDSMPRAKTIERTEISPNGKLVAWISEGKIHLELVEALRGATGKDIALPNGLEARELAWSPDSQTVAFIGDENGAIPASQLWIVDVKGSHSHKLANLRGYVSTPSYSPDAKTIAVLFMENMPRKAGPLVPMTPPRGLMEEKIYEQRIATIDVASGEVKQVSPPDMYVYEYDWAPDGKSWAVSAAKGSGDNNWWIARLYIVDAASDAMREILNPKLQIAVPRFSPDGQRIAYISGIMSDQGSTGGDIYVIPVSGGEARNLTPGLKASATWLTWTGPNQILFTENIDGSSGIATVSGASGEVRQVWSGFEMLSADGWEMQISLARDGNSSAVVRQSMSSPAEVWAGPIGAWRQLTSLNSTLKAAWGEVRNVHWINDGRSVQGWLLLPKDYDASKKYPLIVAVHGGPSAACMPRWSTANGAASAMGWFVLCANPRGSYGQGEAFTLGN